MANLNAEQLRRLARLGAMARLQQLREEETAIRAAFPELFGARGRSARVTEEAPAERGRRPRKQMTPAQKKAVSERMRKYWAERRKAKAGK